MNVLIDDKASVLKNMFFCAMMSYIDKTSHIKRVIVNVNMLFWNLKNNSIEKHIKDCLIENNIDIAVFSEHTGVDFSAFDSCTDYRFIEGMGGCEKVVMLTKKSIQVEIKQEQSRYALYYITNNEMRYIVAGIHLQDRLTTDTATRIACIGRLVNDIKNVENRCGCKNTIIIGDFNANPFDDELLQMNSFNAVLFKDVILKSETRTVDKIQYRRFYNPIIHFVSENTKNYGSFYHTNGSSTPVWHCIDQVLVSKPLVNSIVNLRYLKRINGTSLLKNIRPDATISDHLPLFVEIG
ncbi:MAG: endonuclease/exonuclease/phosphatase family protein [Clostridia bacterium]|nr:endonuclease/exonuclease/phosphatase family protein [Clostridia bacterium]